MHFLVYTRTGCHLCEDAWTLLEDAQESHGFSLEAIDVDSDPELVTQFGECVPVVVVDGKVRFRGQVNPVLLKRLLN
ncbi:MAG: glutaredoxin family protein [Planctomycetes bacterium]|nr:glutaredoxin family protein [Planctomycetota bacterium]